MNTLDGISRSEEASGAKHSHALLNARGHSSPYKIPRYSRERTCRPKIVAATRRTAGRRREGPAGTVSRRHRLDRRLPEYKFQPPSVRFSWGLMATVHPSIVRTMWNHTRFVRDIQQAAGSCRWAIAAGIMGLALRHSYIHLSLWCRNSGCESSRNLNELRTYSELSKKLNIFIYYLNYDVEPLFDANH